MIGEMFSGSFILRHFADYTSLLCLVASTRFQFQCSKECQRPAPFFAGMTEQACDAWGGTWYG